MLQARCHVAGAGDQRLWPAPAPAWPELRTGVGASTRCHAAATRGCRPAAEGQGRVARAGTHCPSVGAWGHTARLLKSCCWSLPPNPPSPNVGQQLTLLLQGCPCLQRRCRVAHPGATRREGKEPRLGPPSPITAQEAAFEKHCIRFSQIPLSGHLF